MANENRTPVNSNGTIIGRAGESVKIGTADNDTLGFHGVTPIARAQVTSISASLLGTLTGTTDGTMENVAAAACAGGATPTAGNVDAAISPLTTSTNLQLKELQTKLNEVITKTNAIITALQNKGIVKS